MLRCKLELPKTYHLFPCWLCCCEWYLELYLDHIKAVMTICLEKKENTLSIYGWAKQIIAKQCGSKCKNLNIMVTRPTFVPTVPVSFADSSGLWSLVLTDAGVMAPAHENPSSLAPVGSPEHPGCGWAVVSTSLCVCRDFIQQPDLECICRPFSRQLEQSVRDQNLAVVDRSANFECLDEAFPDPSLFRLQTQLDFF